MQHICSHAASYSLAFKLKLKAKAEAIQNNYEITWWTNQVVKVC